jgi:hypothetical protein
MSIERDKEVLKSSRETEDGTDELSYELASILNAFDLSIPQKPERIPAEISPTADFTQPPDQLKKGIQPTKSI